MPASVSHVHSSIHRRLSSASRASSKIVSPIAVSTSAADPGTPPDQPAAPASQRRRPSRPSRTSSGARLANIPK
jgi:hypothetical protein